MKNRNILLGLILILLTLIACEDSENVVEPENNSQNYNAELQKYFPSQVGVKLKYSIDSLSKITDAYKNIGYRTLVIQGISFENDEEYTVCNNSFLLDNLDSTLINKFKYKDNSLIFITDTNRVSESIPDSLVGLLDIYLESEINLLKFPLIKNEPWHVIKAKIDFQEFSFNILDITAEYVGKEYLKLDGFTEVFEADKVRYTLDINIPNLANPFISKANRYYAEVWYVEGKGIIKLEGCSLFINPISGMHIEFSDSNKVSRHTLIQ